ncbi:MAG: ATP synthase F0 subunit B [Desulfarculaceae bacterium]|nr:ATP synthase F0 subunit B [Desulfarculaceae bacterium]MCF8073706.1 ATP synthase F0 subunit B [Desulfarculaceae bacterium]MCF8101947.1 ATP synthase F0 subunit B [Desulfarculaceae bacterium]MCF8115917.1 ATP synthase F0 subunit B [Desulfarculaceae bacterium]
MISINATLLVQIVNLLVLIFILNKIMYKPLAKMINERSATIKGGIAEAVALKDKAAENQTQYQRQLGQGRQQVRDRLEQVRRQAEDEARQIVDKAQAQARTESDKLVAEIQGQMAQAQGEIRAQAEEVARTMASRVLGREVS